MSEEGILTGELDETEEAELTAEVEAQENEYLQKMETDDATPDEAVVDSGRNEKGQFTKKEEAESAEPKDTEEPSQEDSVNPDDYRKAIRALQRDGTPDATIDAMDKAQLTEWGLKRAKNQAEVDGYSSRLSDIEKERTGSTTDSVTTEQPNAVPTDLQPILDEVREQYGEELAGPLDKISQMLAAQFDGKLKEQTDKLQDLQNNMTRQHLAEARAKYSEQWGLDSEATYTRVEDAMRVLDRTGQYNSIDSLTEAACTFALAGNEIQRLKSNMAGEHKARSNGQSTPTNRAKKPDPVSSDDMEAKLHAAIADNDIEERDRLARKLGKGAQPTAWLDLEGIVGE